MPLSEECFVTDGIVKLSIFNIYKTLFYAEILVFISVPCKAVLGIYTWKNKIKVSMQRIVNESDYCKKWNLREARKLTMVFLKNIYQGTGVLNYKRMFRHLLEIYTLYVTIETFICFSTHSTWVVFVISRLLLLSSFLYSKNSS